MPEWKYWASISDGSAVARSVSTASCSPGVNAVMVSAAAGEQFGDASGRGVADTEPDDLLVAGR
jgi:hypothetical protein